VVGGALAEVLRALRHLTTCDRGAATRVAAPPNAQACEIIPFVSAMDEYLEPLPAAQKAALERVRSIVGALVPDAEEGTSYGMPAFIYSGRPLLGFGAAKNHLSIFPFSPAAVEAVRDRLQGFDLAKGTIRFSPEQPVPEDVLADVVRARREEIVPR
jgi:uncharacterized protein YdhG (YjbR/CyaY superfamily)